jgi:endonuclease IV
VIELSALREAELDDLINALDELDLSQFTYVSFHAPSKLKIFSERDLINKLHIVKEKGLNIIVHPDVIIDSKNWKSLGSNLCIENMDKRKSIGRTSKDLEEIFRYLPEATFCLDLAHVRQVDPSMTEAYLMIKKFGDRLAQIHLSDVNSQSIHEALNFESVLSYLRVAEYIDAEVPIVLESPVSLDKIELEMQIASLIFDKKKLEESLKYSGFTFS